MAKTNRHARIKSQHLRQIENRYIYISELIKMKMVFSLKNHRGYISYKIVIGDDWKTEGAIVNDFFYINHERIFAEHIFHALEYYASIKKGDIK